MNSLAAVGKRLERLERRLRGDFEHVEVVMQRFNETGAEFVARCDKGASEAEAEFEGSDVLIVMVRRLGSKVPA